MPDTVRERERTPRRVADTAIESRFVAGLGLELSSCWLTPPSQRNRRSWCELVCCEVCKREENKLSSPLTRVSDGPKKKTCLGSSKHNVMHYVNAMNSYSQIKYV